MSIDKLNEKILNALLENSRLSYREIAKKLKKSVATIMKRVRQLEQEGVIKNYSAVLDYEKLGYDVAVLVEVKVSKGKLFEVEKKISAHQNVVAVYDHTGPFDALILAKFKTRKFMDDFLKQLQAYDFVERTETMLILNILKEAPMKI